MNGKIGTALSWVGNTIKMLNGRYMEVQMHEMGCNPIQKDVKEIHDAFYDTKDGLLVQMTEIKTIVTEVRDNGDKPWDGIKRRSGER